MSTLLIALIIIVILLLSITPFLLPTIIEYHSIYKQVQDGFGLSDIQCIWYSITDAFRDVFNLEMNDESDEDTEADQ